MNKIPESKNRFLNRHEHISRRCAFSFGTAAASTAAAVIAAAAAVIAAVARILALLQDLLNCRPKIVIRGAASITEPR